MAALEQYLTLDATSPSYLSWKRAPSRRVLAGAYALCNKDTSGYLRGMFRRKHYQAHRVVFYLVYGYMPQAVDHIDGNINNNTPINLRAVSLSENQHNRIVRGYSYCKQTGKWRASIRVGGHSKTLGRFDTEQQANAAYLSAKASFHPSAPDRVYGGVLLPL